MDETLPGGTEPTAVTAGDRLRAAREAAGLSLVDIAARTRVPQRQLEAVEHGRYAALPSPTYAVGFAKAYARAVGADEVEIATAVRDEIARVGTRAPGYEPYEVADPARVPSRGLAIVAAGVALAVLVLVGLWYGTGLFGGDRSAPAPEPTIATAPAPAPSPAGSATPPVAASPTAAAGTHVRLTATGEVWMRVYDAADKTLFIGTMKAGDHVDVPADAAGPMVNIGRPGQVAVTLDGRPVPPLATEDRPIRGVKVDAASIAARPAAPSAPAPTPAPAMPPATTAVAPAASPRDRVPPHGARRRPRDETARANLDSARRMSAAPPAR